MNDTVEEIVDEPTVDEAEQPEITDEPETQERQEPAPVTPAWSEDDEEEARLFGWKSPDEWKGEVPKGYIDNPEDFLGRVKRSKIFTAMEQRLETTSAGLERVNQLARERQQKQHEAEIERVRRERNEAFENGDTEAYNRADAAELDLRKNAPTEQSPTPDPVLEAYRVSEAGKWMENPELVRQAGNLVSANPAMNGKTTAEHIAYAEGEIRKMYPAYFKSPENPRPAPRQVVDGGGIGGGQTPRDAFSKLPASAKSTFKQEVAKGVFEDTPADRKEYADAYNG